MSSSPTLLRQDFIASNAGTRSSSTRYNQEVLCQKCKSSDSTNLPLYQNLMITSYCCYSKATFIFIQYHEMILFIFRFFCVHVYVQCIMCILNDPLIVIKSFEIEFKVIQKIHLLPWPLSVLSNVVLSARLKFFFSDLLTAEMQRPERQPC